MHTGKDKIDELITRLEERGYKKLTSCKSKDRDDFEWFKAVKYKNGDLKYQIFFEFWDFTKYGGPDWGVSVTIMPESVKDSVGRRDLELSVDWSEDIDRVEKAAEGFYKFIRKVDKDGKN
jgi:hypothetical protein